MAATLTVLACNASQLIPGASKHAVCTLNYGNPYGSYTLTAALLQTAINAAFPATGTTVTAITKVVASGRSPDGTVIPIVSAAASPVFTAWLPGVSTQVDTAGVANTPTVITAIDSEAVAVSSNTGTLANLPISIIAADITAGTATGPAKLVPTAPAATLEVQVVPSTGVINTLAGDAVTEVTVAYAYKTAGVANTPTTVTTGVDDAAYGAVDLSNAAKTITFDVYFT